MGKAQAGLVKHPPSKLTTGCFSLHTETSREEPADRLGCDSVAGEWGTLGSRGWAVGKEDQITIGVTVKAGHKTARGLQGCGSFLLRHTSITMVLVPFLLFSRALQLRFWVASDLSQVPTQQFPGWRSRVKAQSLRASGETLWGWSAQNAAAEMEIAQGGNKEKRGESTDLAWTCGSQGEHFPSASSRADSGRADQGHRAVKLAWKFPACTVLLIALFSTTFY